MVVIINISDDAKQQIESWNKIFCPWNKIVFF